MQALKIRNYGLLTIWQRPLINIRRTRILRHNGRQRRPRTKAAMFDTLRVSEAVDELRNGIPNNIPSASAKATSRKD